MKKTFLYCLTAVLALALILLPANAAEADTHTVTFVAGGETFATVTVPHGDDLGNMPLVPEKDGYSGIWDRMVETVYGDAVVTAIYTPLSSVPEKADQGLLWLVLPVMLASALAMAVTTKKHAV